MEYVFETSDSLEAHLIKDLLERNDIPAQVLGDQLQGGVGKLSPISYIKVAVENHFASSARSIISSWEDQQPKIEEAIKADTDYSRHTSKWALVFLSGMLVGAVICYWVFRPAPYKNYHDRNNDGHSDLIFLSEGYSHIIQEDNNFDSNIDNIFVSDYSGIMQKSENDYDFDGVFETKGFYKQGRIARIESDFNNDGKAETIQYFEDGALDKIVYKDEFDKTRRVELYRKDIKRKSAKFDENGDGIFDIEYKYDDFGEIIQ